MKRIILVMISCVMMISCSSGKYFLPVKRELIYLNVSSNTREIIEARFNTRNIILNNGKIVYGLPPDANMKSLPVCVYRGRYFYIKYK